MLRYGVLVAVLAVSSPARPGEAGAGLPTFELMGFPITRHQVQVTGAADLQERSPTGTLALGGMPASPHQIAVLTPRPRMANEQTPANLLTKAGFSAPR
jgi:hypothetical protein